MALTPSFELAALKRDWIVGIPGEAFYAMVCARRDEIAQLSASERRRGILIAVDEPVEFAAVFFAALSLSAPVILANPNWGQQERDELNQLVAPAKWFGMDPGKPCAEIRDLSEGAILVPTGGSTGGVKLAIHSIQSLRAACAGVQDFIGGGVINSCCLLPLYHVSGLMQLLRSFYSGGRIRFDDTEVKDYCVSYVPTQLQRALSDPRRIQKLVTARAVFVGGGPLSDSIAEQARGLALPIVPVYGMTETAAMVAAIPAAEFLQNATCGAVAISAARIEIDPDKRIRIHSSALFSGYHGRPSLDLADGYLTEDEGFLDAEGRLHVLGRIDRLIISGGEKIDPREVEQALLKIDSVQQVLVIGAPSEEWGQQVVAFCVPSLGQKLSDDWRTQLKLNLANYKIPKRLIVVDALPVDRRGKVDKEFVQKLL
ncbi:MAG: AMP-binding protein [Lentimonas sp.]